MYFNSTAFDTSTLQIPNEAEYDPAAMNTNTHRYFFLSFIQSFVLILFAQISDQSIISYILIQSSTNTHTAFLSCSMSSIILIFLCCITGYGLSICLPSPFTDCLAIICLLVASVCLIKQSQRSHMTSLEEDYNNKKQSYAPQLDLRRQLSIIAETNKEDNGSIDDKDSIIPFPLLDRISSCGYIDQKEEMIDDIDLNLVFETTGKLIVSDWLNQTYFYVLIISMVFDLKAALPGVLCSIMLQYMIGNCYWSAIKHLIPMQIDLILAGILAVYGIQILLLSDTDY